MELRFLDTNVILRYLTKDHTDHSAAAQEVLQQVADGDLLVTTSETIIAEAVYVLSSRGLYNLSRSEIRRHLSNILRLQGMILPTKQTYARALEVYASTSLDFEDALSIAHMEALGITTIISFDRDFDRFPAINREEPRAKDTR